VDQQPLLANVLQDLLLHLEGDLWTEGVVLRELGVKVKNPFFFTDRRIS
jgi:hypothetical protein